MDNRIQIQAKISAFRAELEMNITKRRKNVIISELHKLSALLGENDKNYIEKLEQQHNTEIIRITKKHKNENLNLNKEVEQLRNELQKINKLKAENKSKAQKLFTKLNAKLTPSEMTLFADGLNFIRDTHLK